jgi:hypothetical protein
MIVADPADNAAQGITQNDAKSETEAKLKIDNVSQQLKGGADFATVARDKSEDPSFVRGGDLGFATEEDLKQNGFPSDLISRLFGPMQTGDTTEPIRFVTGKWYVFKLAEKRLQTENLTLESPNVRQQITQALINQRKEILKAALLEVAMNDAKIVNKLAGTMLETPSNLGLRPASSGAVPATATTPAPAATATPQSAASPAAATPAASPQASPRANASPRP